MVATLEIEDDGFAVIRGENGRYELTGGNASSIIAMYRHQQEKHGDANAQTYLMGVIDGLIHEHEMQAQEVIERYRRRYP